MIVAPQVIRASKALAASAALPKTSPIVLTDYVDAYSLLDVAAGKLEPVLSKMRCTTAGDEVRSVLRAVKEMRDTDVFEKLKASICATLETDSAAIGVLSDEINIKEKIEAVVKTKGKPPLTSDGLWGQSLRE